LRKWVAEKKAPGVIAKAMGKTEDAVLRKIKRLGLEVVAAESCRNPATTSRLSLPKDLMSVEIKLYPNQPTSLALPTKHLQSLSQSQPQCHYLPIPIPTHTTHTHTE
jgi:hypothetical protein